MDVNDLEQCPRCKGTGVDPEQSVKPTPSGQVNAASAREAEEFQTPRRNVHNLAYATGGRIYSARDGRRALSR
jgi:hypothetical protein